MKFGTTSTYVMPWPFQCDYVMREVVGAHCRTRARRAFVGKKVYPFFLMAYCFARKYLYSLAGIV